MSATLYERADAAARLFLTDPDRALDPMLDVYEEALPIGEHTIVDGFEITFLSVASPTLVSRLEARLARAAGTMSERPLRALLDGVRTELASGS